MHWDPVGPKMPEAFVEYTHLDSETLVSSKLLADFFREGLNLTVSTCDGICH